MSGPHALRIGTLNLWKNEADLPSRLIAVIQGLAALVPDVVFLQEVFRLPDASFDAGQIVANELGLSLVYAPARLRPRAWQGKEPLSESGLAVLVRGEVRSSRRLTLPTHPKGGERIALLVEALLQGRMLSLGVTHLSHLRNDDSGRRDQLLTVLGDPFWQLPASGRFLGGDFNCEWTSSVFADLDQTEGSRPALRPLHAHPSHPPATFPLPPRREPSGRALDWLFSVEAGHSPSAMLLNHGLALNQPLGEIWPSDHAAVWADLQLPSSQS